MCFSFNNSHVCYLVSDRLPDLCLWNWRLRCLSWKSDWELVVGFIWILVQESKTTNRHFEKWHESDMKGIIYMKRPSSDFQNAIKNESLQYCTKNWTPYCWFIFLVHYIFTCLWVKHWHTVIREPLWGGTPVIMQKTHS